MTCIESDFYSLYDSLLPIYHARFRQGFFLSFPMRYIHILPPVSQLCQAFGLHPPANSLHTGKSFRCTLSPALLRYYRTHIPTHRLRYRFLSFPVTRSSRLSNSYVLLRLLSFSSEFRLHYTRTTDCSRSCSCFSAVCLSPTQAYIRDMQSDFPRHRSSYPRIPNNTSDNPSNRFRNGISFSLRRPREYPTYIRSSLSSTYSRFRRIRRTLFCPRLYYPLASNVPSRHIHNAPLNFRSRIPT